MTHRHDVIREGHTVILRIVRGTIFCCCVNIGPILLLLSYTERNYIRARAHHLVVCFVKIKSEMLYMVSSAVKSGGFLPIRNNPNIGWWGPYCCSLYHLAINIKGVHEKMRPCSGLCTESKETVLNCLFFRPACCPGAYFRFIHAFRNGRRSYAREPIAQSVEWKCSKKCRKPI
jgi:hypothetical protein